MNHIHVYAQIPLDRQVTQVTCTYNLAPLCKTLSALHAVHYNLQANWQQYFACYMIALDLE